MVEVEPAEDQAFVLGVEGRPPAGGVEDQGIALEEPGQLLVAHVTGAVGAAAGQAVGLDEAGPGLGLDELGVDEIDVRLLDGDLTGDLGAGRLGARGLSARVVRSRHGAMYLLSVVAWSSRHSSRPAACARWCGVVSPRGERTSLASRADLAVH